MSSPLPHPWPAHGSCPLLGTNGTEAMRSLLPGGGADLVDYLKVGPFMGRQAIAELAPEFPLLLHLDDTLSGHSPLSEEAVQSILVLIQLTGTPWTSAHIGFGVADVDLDGAHITQPASDLLSREKTLRNIVRNARALEAVAQTHGTRRLHALVYGSVDCFAAYSAKSRRVALCATA